MKNQQVETSPVGGRSWGVPPHETPLKTEDFMAPNPVLCYGGGGAFQSVAPYMMACGINLVGVIDANRKGSIEISGRELPVLTVQEAIETYGTETVVIITIANQAVFQQVKQNLTTFGYVSDKLFDMNIWTWLTVPSEKSSCRFLGEYLQFFPAALSKCCNTGVVDAFLCEWFMEGRPLEESIDHFLEKRLYYMEESKRGRIPLYCRNCNFLTQEPGRDGRKVTEFVVSDHAFCNADCVYCCDACTVPRKKTGATVEERYAAILYALERLQQEDVLDRRGMVQFAGGEITINPYKEKIYATLKRVLTQSPELQLQLFSNCFLYDQEIADLLSLGRESFLQCDLDAGTPETYIKVKGFHKFNIVRKNLKTYAQFGTVKLKYIVLPGWNDSQADFEGAVDLLKELGIGEMTLSLEFGLSRNGERMRALATHHLITAREGITAQVLREHGLSNVVQVSDIAFSLRPSPAVFRAEGEYVAINLSPLVVRRNRGALTAFQALVEKILKETPWSIALVPHVLAAADNDDEVLKLFNKNNPRVWKVSQGLSASELKYIISKARFCIAARTHACIAAYSSGVPTLAVGYSTKARGIAADIGQDAFVLDADILDAPVLLERFELLLEREEEVKKQLAQVVPGDCRRTPPPEVVEALR